MIRLILLLFTFSIYAQDNTLSKAERLAWFQDAKLGIFIHWGIYSVKGIDESWSFYNGYISHKDYMKQLDGFTADKYNPQEWVDLIAESGAKYTVITTKHHDGVALWDTKYSDNSIAKHGKAKRDVLTPFVNAVKKEGLKLGLYFSLIDWSDPNYPNFTRNEKRYTNDLKKWDKFVTQNFKQLEELTTYNPDLYWFDGDWEFSAEEWKSKDIRDLLLKNTPHAIINSRLNQYGDYSTPEQGVPILRPKNDYWELCLTMNNSWGYQPNDKAYKSSNQIIRILVECINLGGNLLLDIGPKADGTIPKEQKQILQDLGRWTKKHEQAIYGTRAGIPPEHFNGQTALSKDKKTLYLYVDNKPNGKLLLKGLKNKVNRMWVVGNGTKLSYDVVGKHYWNSIPGLLYIDLPEKVQDPDVTVIAVLLDGEIDLYRNEGRVIDDN